MVVGGSLYAPDNYGCLWPSCVVCEVSIRAPGMVCMLVCPWSVRDISVSLVPILPPHLYNYCPSKLLGVMMCICVLTCLFILHAWVCPACGYFRGSLPAGLYV